METARIAAHKRGWHFRDADDLKLVLEDLNLMDHGRLTNAAVILFAKEAVTSSSVSRASYGLRLG